MSANVFCCHSSSDKDIVRPVAQALIDDGHSVFIDEWSLGPGDSLVEKIPLAISESGVFVLFLSAAVLESAWCSRELAIAASQMLKSGSLRVFAFRLEAVEPPLIIDDLLYIDAVSRGYEVALDQLKLAVEGRLPSPQAEAYEDISILPFNVSFTGPKPAPYFASVQIRAKRFSHPRLYVKLIATAPIHEKFVLDQAKFTGVRSAIATAIHGQVLEHTEGPPGLEPAHPWGFCIFSEQPISIADVQISESNPFTQVSELA